MFGETTIFYLMIWKHPVETTTKNWLFGVPGKNGIILPIQGASSILPLHVNMLLYESYDLWFGDIWSS